MNNWDKSLLVLHYGIELYSESSVYKITINNIIDNRVCYSYMYNNTLRKDAIDTIDSLINYMNNYEYKYGNVFQEDFIIEK